MNAEVVALSTDSHWSQAAFAKTLGVEIPFVSDYNREIATRYVGFYEQVSGYSNVNRRAIVVIDSKATVRWTWDTDDPGKIPDTHEIWQVVQDIFHDS